LIVSVRRLSRKLTAGLAAVGALGLVGAGLVIGAGSSSAVAVTLTQTYNCPFPLIGTQPVKVVVNSDMPATIAVGQATGAFNIQAISTVPAAAAQGLALVGATSIEGSAVSGDLVTAPNLNLPVNVPITIPNQPVPASGAFDINATGSTPSLTFGASNVGTAKIFVNTLTLTLIARKADGTPVDFGAGTSDPNTKAFTSACTLDPASPTQLHQFEITGSGGGTTTTTAGTTTTTAGTTTTGATTTTTAGTTTTTAGTTTGATTTTTGATTTTTGGTTTTTTGTAPTTTTVTTPPDGNVAMSYGLKGSSTLRKLHGTIPLSGRFDALADLKAGTYTGDLKLDPTTGHFRLFGFLPVRADIAFTPVGKSSGTIGDKAITYTGKLTTKLTRITFFGFPLYRGDTCQTITPSDINLKSLGAFDVLTGGRLAGKYDLSEVKGCGPFTSFISPFVQSTDNTITITLKKK
jgi:hypothetical protein